MCAFRTKSINDNFFKKWSSNMAYVLGYFVADGCIGISKGRKKPYVFSITSIDTPHLYKIRKAMGSTHKLSVKFNGDHSSVAHQLQFRNETIALDLIKMGITPRKTYNLPPIKVPDKYFPDFVRGFFDGDGSVFIYTVNGVPQIKGNFVCVSLSFIEDFNSNLCKRLKIPQKYLQKSQPRGKDTYLLKYHIAMYISDCEKLFKFMYGNNPELYLTRKYKVFQKWNSLTRRHYIKTNYPSKVGWHLNKNASK